MNIKRERCQAINSGVDFLGYIVRRDYLLPRRRVINQLRQRLLGYQKQLLEIRADCRVYHFDYEVLEQCRATLASYWGHLLHADSYQLRQRLLLEFSFLQKYFVFFDDGKITALFVIPKNFKTARQQYYFYRWRFFSQVIFFQVDFFYEFYHHKDDEIALVLGLHRMRLNRRGVRYGFPSWQLNRMLEKLLGYGREVLVVKELNAACDKIKYRGPAFYLGHKQ